MSVKYAMNPNYTTDDHFVAEQPDMYLLDGDIAYFPVDGYLSFCMVESDVLNVSDTQNAFAHDVWQFGAESIPSAWFTAMTDLAAILTFIRAGAIKPTSGEMIQTHGEIGEVRFVRA